MSHSKENTQGSEQTGDKSGLAVAPAVLGKSPVSLDRLIDFLPDPTYAIDTNGTVILWNKALEDIWGVRSQDMLGKGNYEYAIPFYGHRRPVLANMVLGDGMDMDRNYSSLTRRGDSILAEGYMQTPQGVIYVMAKAGPIYDSAGTVIGAIETIRDITERVDTGNEIRSREAQYRDIFENVSDLLYVHDLGGRIIESNLPFKKEFGYSRDDLKNITIQDLLPPQVREGYRDFIHRLLDSGTAEGVTRILTKTGEERIVEYRDSLIRDKLGRPVAIRGSARDITERMQAIKALRRSEERFRAMAEASPVVFWMTSLDPLQKVIYASPAFERIFGRTCEELLLNPRIWFECIHPQDAAQVRSLIQKKAEKPLDFEFRIVRPDDSVRWIRARVAPIPDHTGKTALLSGIAEDITEHKHAEQEKKIYEDRLARALRLEAIGTLAGGIAHDFNNILAAIIGYTELAMEDVPPGNSAVRSLHEVLKAGERAKDLVSQILTFSRQARTEKKVVRVQLIVKQALKLLRSSIPSTIAITQDIDPHSPEVFADPTQIHQVVMNLCANAYQAMRDRGGTLAVGLAPVELDTALARSIPRLEPGSYLHLWVSDTGCGMDQDTLDRIFEPFFTTREKGKGTGLGLATVHGIVSDLSGAVTVSSTIGDGSTFHVYLPTCKAEDRKDETGEDAVPRGNGERILLVDDESAILAFAQSMIEQMGYSARTHSSSIQALEAFSQAPHAFDLIITDQTMPLLTGVELAAKVQAIRSDIPIILITGFSEIISAEQARKQGICVYLEKPFTRNSLARAIRQALVAS